MNLNFLVKNESRLSDITDEILNFANSNLFLLYGKMGVGKTTFIKSFCSSLNVIDIVSSPTFSIVNEYKTLEESSVFHFDFFRTNNKNEIFDIGYEEYIFSSSYCFIEWPEIIEELLPTAYVKIEMILEGSMRKIVVENINLDN
jgi:tRNA threonylcarbamoyladenosine biosynthesis protein TsaE|tara:strand:- start:8612 stop:9043 length:432 start_codon:yes stop_codon:yes gene_type:complete